MIALVSRGTPEANRAKSAEHGLTQVLLQDDREVAESYRADGTPSAVIVRPDGTIGSPVAAGAEAIRALVAQVLGRPAPVQLPIVAPPHGGNGHDHAPAWPRGPAVGERAPALRLPALSGKTVSLADFQGSTTVVLFWNPGCGFCQRMLPELKAWEANPPQGAPKLLVVSTGTVEANQVMGLRSPVVLDHGFTAGRAFGVTGTPMAVLVDAQGRIAAEVAAGAPAVLALLQADRAQAPSARA
jgi:peroxiredoxin